ncbi:Serine/threonine-protein phosphatase 2A activator 1 [Pleurotus pulmonarius]|nr:Serine/threonine-protein phosphatase 2A activator 1 [Pleurotus pulmonarius]
MASQAALPDLRRIDIASLKGMPKPAQKIRFDSDVEAILGIIGVLDRLDRWIDDIPPLDSPQRFGNLAFRTWGKRLEELYAIATGVPNWRKVNSGLFKMYEAEVLAKRVVVQHIPLGGILEWDPIPPSAMVPNSSTRAPWLSPGAEPLNPPMSTGWLTPTPHGSSGGVDSALNAGSDDPRNRAARSTPRTQFPAPP